MSYRKTGKVRLKYQDVDNENGRSQVNRNPRITLGWGTILPSVAIATVCLSLDLGICGCKSHYQERQTVSRNNPNSHMIFDREIREIKRILDTFVFEDAREKRIRASKKLFGLINPGKHRSGVDPRLDNGSLNLAAELFIQMTDDGDREIRMNGLRGIRRLFGDSRLDKSFLDPMISSFEFLYKGGNTKMRRMIAGPLAKQILVQGIGESRRARLLTLSVDTLDDPRISVFERGLRAVVVSAVDRKTSVHLRSLLIDALKKIRIREQKRAIACRKATASATSGRVPGSEPNGEYIKLVQEILDRVCNRVSKR